jgi:hypothetical protein
MITHTSSYVDVLLLQPSRQIFRTTKKIQLNLTCRKKRGKMGLGDGTMAHYITFLNPFQADINIQIWYFEGCWLLSYELYVFQHK